MSEVLELRDGDAWETWLAQHHDTAGEAWLRIAKKGSGLELLSISDALDGALCFGWIDGQRKGLDGVSFLQRYCPRRARSSWSQVNVGKVAALLAAGRMRPAGLAQVDAARADGRWAAAYERQRTATVPDDLRAALDADPLAGAAFHALGRTERYAVMLPVLKATTPEARALVVRRQVERLAAYDGPTQSSRDG
ncbi:YdeI/OmpD-associated family protein [Nocardioides sp. URHA0020]|uniref:YdeI/OmpD-associated family protein n=1 Tax=Nocardioides sp. URHA0020 TaxID=1380392 RepID=UPI000560A0E9|nr:YdeI/OmpD-associated family protein [Nocardioides sp. URHA0020]